MFAESYREATANCPSTTPEIAIDDNDDAAIYFSSGTTGFPKAILHSHRSLLHAATAEQKHHGETRQDVQLIMPPLYHTGAKIHWMGSFLVGGKAVLLKGTKPQYILDAVSKSTAPSCGSWYRGCRIFSIPSTAANAVSKITSSISGG